MRWGVNDPCRLPSRPSPPRQLASSTSSSDSTSPGAPEANLGTGGQDDGPTSVKRRKSDDGGGRKRIRAVIRSMLQYGDKGSSGSIKGSREDARKSGFNLNNGSSQFKQVTCFSPNVCIYTYNTIRTWDIINISFYHGHILKCFSEE